MKNTGLTLFFIFFCILLPLHGQYIPGSQWQQIENQQYQIIFPEGMEEQALELAQFNERIYSQITQGYQLPRTVQYPLILYPMSMTSNGYVTSLNHHSLWFTKPYDRFAGSLPWLEMLSIHEGRHVIQMQMLNQSTNRALYFIGGEIFSSLAVGVTPSWIYEGDAVYAETKFSQGGRGRSGSFLTPMTIGFQQNRLPNYSSLQFPSRKSPPTNAYDFGYLFTNWLKEEYSEDILNDFFRYQAQLPLPLFGTLRAFKKTTDLRLRHNFRYFQNDMVEHLIDSPPWEEGIYWLTQPENHWSTMDYPVLFDDQILYVKNSYSHSCQLYASDNDSTYPLGRIRPETQMSISGDLLVWDRVWSSQRYPMATKYEIVLKNLNEGTEETILGPGRFYSPAISPNGSTLAVLEISELGDHWLVLFDMEGEELINQPLQSIYGAHGLAWSPSGDTLIFVSQLSHGVSLTEYNIDTGELYYLTPALPINMSNPLWIDDEPAFLLDLPQGKKLFKVSQEQPWELESKGYGISGAVPADNGSLYVVSTTSFTGQQLGLIERPTWNQRQWVDVINHGELLFNDLLIWDMEDNRREYERTDEYEVKPYNPDFFHPYAWGFYSLAGNMPWDPVIPLSMISQDPLKSNQWEVSLLYNRNEFRPSVRMLGQLNLLYTPIQFQLSQQLPGNQWEETNTQSAVELKIPLGITRGTYHWQSPIKLGMHHYYSIGSDNSSTQDLLVMARLDYQGGFLSASRDLGNPWGHYLSGYIYQPYNHEDNLWGISTMFTIPSFLNQRLVGKYSYQWNTLQLSSQVGYPRGWLFENHQEQQQWTVEYQIPLLYPEMEIGRALYISRVRANIFYDGMVYSENYISTIGGELAFDFYPLQIPIEIDGGVRINYKIEEGEIAVDLFVLSSSLGYF